MLLKCARNLFCITGALVKFFIFPKRIFLSLKTFKAQLQDFYTKMLSRLNTHCRRIAITQRHVRLINFTRFNTTYNPNHLQNDLGTPGSVSQEINLKDLLEKSDENNLKDPKPLVGNIENLSDTLIEDMLKDNDSKPQTFLNTQTTKPPEIPEASEAPESAQIDDIQMKNQSTSDNKDIDESKDPFDIFNQNTLSADNSLLDGFTNFNNSEFELSKLLNNSNNESSEDETFQNFLDYFQKQSKDNDQNYDKIYNSKETSNDKLNAGQNINVNVNVNQFNTMSKLSVKIQPAPEKILILTPDESKFRKRVPTYLKDNDRYNSRKILFQSLNEKKLKRDKAAQKRLLKDGVNLDKIYEQLTRKQNELFEAQKERLIKDRLKTSLTNLATFNFEEKTKTLLNFRSTASIDEVTVSINDLKPSDRYLSEYEFKTLYNSLLEYQKDSLNFYILQYYPEVTINRKHLKAQVVSSIIEVCWKIVNPHKSATTVDEEVFSTKIIPINKIMNHLLFNTFSTTIYDEFTKGNLVKISKVNNQEDQCLLKVSGTRSAIAWFEVSYSNVFSKLKTREMNLKFFPHLLDFIQNIGNISLHKIPDNENHEYFAFGINLGVIQRAERLLLWKDFDNNKHLSQVFYNFDKLIGKENIKAFDYMDDSSIPRIHKTNKWQRLKQNFLLNSPEENEKINSEENIEIESENIFNELMKSECQDSNVKNVNYIHDENTILTASLGQVLLDKNSDLKMFDANIPNIKNIVKKLKLFNAESDLDTSSKDNHSYYAQIRFVPSAFRSTDDSPLNILFEKEDEIKKSDDKVLKARKRLQSKLVSPEEAYHNYPPLEMWFEVNDKDIADTNSLRLEAIEKEKTVFVNLPDKGSDVSFVKTTSKTLANFRESINLLKQKQPYVTSFLEKSKLIFDGSELPTIPRELKVVIDGEVVNYSYVYINLRRQIDLEYKGRLLQISKTSAGQLGGEKIEATLVYDLSEESEADFIDEDENSIAEKDSEETEKITEEGLVENKTTEQRNAIYTQPKFTKFYRDTIGLVNSI
ncbi:uncharacterized protein ASCRUDRAFT_141568 [Ascoidea rubescens DSM 1968]|uniref:SLS1 C-terminal domain-containing protein n=1 Tax=Ascoidea rubescens DSM 1968 TaxID=1344418 RepID=A0A1D2VIQ0_9ASCO|nr:hypothetical protein ASCRUDRAFT_141568 [Ascoidea rubescens DSM 1968]ODV61367.1 hypothetical protein ASCRUDRAFT_141568 [Ascoidea rubescens DSM 1968]